MKRLFLIAGLMTAFGLAVLAASAASANFAGTWSLDKTKSQNLSRGMQNAESVSWVITQNDKTISIESKVTGGQPPAGGGPGGGGGGMGGPRVYNLDGTETTSDITGQATGKATSKATWASDGKVLELSRKSVVTTPNGEVTSTTTQKLELSGDGKVLTVNQHSESPRGPQDSTLVFNKQ
jgi:hypothetical protein